MNTFQKLVKTELTLIKNIMDYGQFYHEIESGVREWVFWFRNAGVNTECSCHHKGYIQCQILDPTSDVMKIKGIMMEHNILDFEIEIKYRGFDFSIMEIRSPYFEKDGGIK